MRPIYNINQQQSEWQILVDAPLSSDILDYSGNNNHFTAQSSGNTFNDNALYITGTNRGVTLGNNFFADIWDRFKIEMDIKWSRKANCGVLMIGGSWPNSGNTLGIIYSTTDSFFGLYENVNYVDRKQSLNMFPVNIWLHVDLAVVDGYITAKVLRNDTQEVIGNISVSKYQQSGYGNGNLLLGGGFNYSQYWNGWIKNFKLYKHI